MVGTTIRPPLLPPALTLDWVMLSRDSMDAKRAVCVELRFMVAVARCIVRTKTEVASLGQVLRASMASAAVSRVELGGDCTAARQVGTAGSVEVSRNPDQVTHMSNVRFERPRHETKRIATAVPSLAER
eukprot:6740405-Prymnesium_polylepis.1